MAGSADNTGFGLDAADTLEAIFWQSLDLAGLVPTATTLDLGRTPADQVANFDLGAAASPRPFDNFDTLLIEQAVLPVSELWMDWTMLGMDFSGPLRGFGPAAIYERLLASPFEVSFVDTDPLPIEGWDQVRSDPLPRLDGGSDAVETGSLLAAPLHSQDAFLFIA